MRKRLIASLSLLFLLFSVGAGLSMLYTYKITKDFDSMMTLHRIEIMRQIFVNNVQTVQGNLYATGTVFGKELDTTVENVMTMDNAIQGCQGCHHTPEMTERLKKVHAMVEQYKDAISYLVTSTANEQRIERLKMVAVGIGEALISQTQEMAEIADRTLTRRTEEAVAAISKSRNILAMTVIISFPLALGIAIMLTRQITKPVHALVNASRMIASGKFGFKTDYTDHSEFGEVANSFNAMSAALQAEHDKTDHYIEQLSGLYKVTLSFYDILEMEQAYQVICADISDILKVRQTILLLFDEKQKIFTPSASAGQMSAGLRAALQLPLEEVVDLYQKSEGQPVIINNASHVELFSALVPEEEHEQNVMLAWLLTKEKILGAIRVSDNNSYFTDEDSKILIILANHMAVAMENADLYRNLQNKMAELRETQEQLIQSAKLAAIGELASNVAHEINNPLTSIIGFAELSKEDDDIESMRKSIGIIEKESLRARDIVKQLLDFARKKPLQLTEVNINAVVKEVIAFSSSQTRMGKVKVTEEYSDIPMTSGDVDQLKQVFLNIMTNAIHSMPEGGGIAIRTFTRGEYILVSLSDTGHGISDEVRNRIFEPFFSTKKEKGTGLGLSISYRIIQDHGGRIDVESEPGKGSTFTVRLPQKLPVKTV
jgi:signal transduction histidine kinase/HAMP domain-containing protein